jgi:hypothetical protein
LINAGVTHTPAFIGLHNMYGYSIQKKNLLSSFFGGSKRWWRSKWFPCLLLSHCARVSVDKRATRENQHK